MPSFPISVCRQRRPQDDEHRAHAGAPVSTSRASFEAIFLYDAHYQATDDPAAKAAGRHPRRGEGPLGELITLMRHLDP